MPDYRFTFDPAKVKLTDEEILADLTYPARARSTTGQQRRRSRRRSRRR